MLGKTAGGLFWMFRNLERAGNTARLIEAGFRIALTRSSDPESEWKSVIVTSASRPAYTAKHDGYDSARVTDFLLRDPDNPNSVLSVIKGARDNARLVRTALTTEVWMAVNETWMVLTKALKDPVPETDLPEVLSLIRQQSALVRGALHGTMLRNDIYDFARIGTFLERADNTARILDVKYYVLLPSVMSVGSSIDNMQWETILRSVSARGGFRMSYGSTLHPRDIAQFLILDGRMPRSLGFCVSKIRGNLDYLAKNYDIHPPSCENVARIEQDFLNMDIDAIFRFGLHEFIQKILGHFSALGAQIEIDFRFSE